MCSTGWFKQNCFRSHCSPIVRPPPPAAATLWPCNCQDLAELPFKSGYLQNSQMLQKVVTRLSKRSQQTVLRHSQHQYQQVSFFRFNRIGSHQSRIDNISYLVWKPCASGGLYCKHLLCYGNHHQPKSTIQDEVKNENNLNLKSIPTQVWISVLPPYLHVYVFKCLANIFGKILTRLGF